jgi:hypothetical protein
MGWTRTLAVAALTGIVALVAAAVAANLATHWSDAWGFEGADQFFVMMWAAMGLAGGFFVGLFVSLVVAATPGAAARATAISVTGVLVFIVVVTAVARVLADIPPRLDGETLVLVVELRTPRSHPAPSAMAGAGYLRLGALLWSRNRKEEPGLLFVEDARLEDGRWIIPGIARLFTSRGGRAINAGIGDTPLASFTIPLPAHPAAESLAWSEWLPRDQPPDLVTYRYKVVRQSEPLRIERFGRLTVETTVESFYFSRDGSAVGATSHFRISHEGRPLPGFARVGSVAALNAPQPALLVHGNTGGAPCRLIVDDGAALEVRDFPRCDAPVGGKPLTSDPVRFAAARDRNFPQGWVDRVSFDRPGLFLVDRTVLDTRDLTFSELTPPEGFSPRGLPPPLGLSPDGRSFVWFVHAGPMPGQIGVTDWQANVSYTLPIDRDRMRYIGFETLDPTWVAHHFRWERDPSGVDVLRERPDLVPLPYRGQLHLRKPGEAQGYVLLPAGEALQNEVVRMLVDELHGERLSNSSDGGRRVRLDGKMLHIRTGSTLVSVTMDFGEADPELLKRVAAHLDAAWATGRYDALFRVSSNQ